MQSEQSSFNIIDIESSGLSSNSFPIEIGIVLDSGETYSALIRPLPCWDYWDESAEALHGISKQQLLREGKTANEVCQEINRFCEGKTLYSDGWTYDSAWLNKLFGYAGIIPRFRITALEPLLGESWSSLRWQHLKKQASNVLGLKNHRAMADALIIQNALNRFQGTQIQAQTLPAAG